MMAAGVPMSRLTAGREVDQSAGKRRREEVCWEVNDGWWKRKDSAGKSLALVAP